VLQVAVLGPLEVRRAGDLVPIPGGKTAEILVRLAIDAGHLVRSDRLIEDLWADAAPATRRNTLQSKVAKLRRALGDPLVVSGGDGGYRLDVDPSTVDAVAVLADAAAASHLYDDGDAAGAVGLSVSGLERFRGDVLPTAGDAAWALPHRARLEEARTALLETQFAARLRLGAAGDVIGELEAAVVTCPYRERLWELLITAQYRAGRQADALSTMQRIRAQLADELGLDPGPRLQQLERQILVHEVTLRGPSRTPQAPAADHGAGNLPTLTAELIGRRTEVDAVCDLLADNRLVELVGPGGVGKTATAIAVGRRLGARGDVGAGVWLARLEAAATPDEVVDAVAAALDVGGEAALFERLTHGPAVLILDNCEHVVDAAAALAVRLLEAAPELRILGTSQMPLDVEGEVVFELPPLSLGEAVDLFTRRASSHRRRRGPLDPDEAVHDLCRALDGLPLAIELAAARTKTLSVDEISRRLDDRFELLRDPTSRRPERRRALGSTIRWSYDLLFPDDQRGLWALSVFADGASLPAVEAVLGSLDVPPAATVDVLDRLVSRSLVIVDDSASTGVRYRLLDSIRAFAREAMTADGSADAAHGAHASWIAGAAAVSTRGVRSSRQAEHLAVARAERSDIDAALTWAATRDPAMALHIATGFGWAWVVLGDSRGAQRILAALGAADATVAAHERAGALLLAAWIEASTGRLALARDHVAAATEIADATGDDDLAARCCYYLAYVVSHDGDFDRALALTERSAALYVQLERPWDQAANSLFAARAAISAGDQPRGVAALALVQHWLRTVDDPWLHVRHDAARGELARLEHRFAEAVAHIGRAAATSRRLGFSQTEAYQLSSLGRAHCQAGDHDLGAATLARAVAKAEAIGDVRLAALARVHLGRVLRALGQQDAARAALEVATAWHRAAGGGEQAALGDCLLVSLDARDGVPGAEARLVAILAAARGHADTPVEVLALDALARLAADAGDLGAARSLGAAADRLAPAAAHVITDFDRTDAHALRGVV
jgi:predicted ATPase/DNA-binding SARP family transcriptional activator